MAVTKPITEARTEINTMTTLIEELDAWYEDSMRDFSSFNEMLHSFSGYLDELFTKLDEMEYWLADLEAEMKEND